MKRIVAIAALLLSLPTIVEARSRGACDGIHRCVCGTTQARHFGLPLTYNGFNLKQAIGWVRAFPRTAIHAGAVGYQRGGGPTGHVFRVVAYAGGCTATVADERGQYERNICSRGARFMDVSGASYATEMSARPHSRRSHPAHAWEVSAAEGTLGPH